MAIRPFPLVWNDRLGPCRSAGTKWGATVWVIFFIGIILPEKFKKKKKKKEGFLITSIIDIRGLHE